MSFLQLIRSS